MANIQSAGVIQISVSRPGSVAHDAVLRVDFDNDADLHEAWTSLHRAKDYSAFAATLLDGHGRLLSSRAVDFEAIEALVDTPISVLLTLKQTERTPQRPSCAIQQPRLRLQ